MEKPGDYFTFEIAGESLFCVKGGDDEIRAFYNVCQHRAHQLVTGAGNARVPVCPDHAWTYELTVRLRSGPNIRSVAGFDRSAICLTDLRTEVFLGFVFVNLDPREKPMDSWYPAALAEIEQWVPNWTELKPLEWIEIPERCNWKTSIENYSECYHCERNHRAFSTGVVKPETYDIQPQGYCLRHVARCQNLEKVAYPIESSRPHAEENSSWFLWPMFSLGIIYV